MQTPCYSTGIRQYPEQLYILHQRSISDHTYLQQCPPIPLDNNCYGTTYTCGINKRDNFSLPECSFSQYNVYQSYVIDIRITYNINGAGNTTIDVNANQHKECLSPAPGTYKYNLVSVQYTTNPTCSYAIAGSAAVTVNPLPVPTIAGPAIGLSEFDPYLYHSGRYERL